MKLKKILAGALASAMTLTAGLIPETINAVLPLAETAVSAADYLPGDITGDGKINIYDAVYISRYLIGETGFTNEQLLVADFNGNGIADLHDAIGIVREMQGLSGPSTDYPAHEGEITIDEVAVEKGDENVQLDAYFTNGTTTNGCIIEFTIKDGDLTFSDNVIGKETVYSISEDGKKLTAVYLHGSLYKEDETFTRLNINIPEDTEPGEYFISANVIDFDNGADGSYDSYTVNWGKVTVEEESDYPDYPGGYDENDGKQGIKIYDVAVTPGTLYAEVPMFMYNTESQGCDINVICEYPLSISKAYGAMMSEDFGSLGTKMVYVSAEGFTSSEQFGSLEIEIAPDAEPGIYPITLVINQLADTNGGDIENPVAISGSITIEENDSPSYPGYDEDDGRQGIKIGDVEVEQGVTSVDVPMYMKNVSSKGCYIEVTCEHPLFIKGSYGYLAKDGDENRMELVYASSEFYSATEPFDYLNMVIDASAEPGTYPIGILIKNLDNNGESVESSVGFWGSVTVREKGTDYPGYDEDDGKPLIKVGDVSSYPDAFVGVPMYIKNMSVKGAILDISCDYPLSLNDSDNNLASEGDENHMTFVYAASRPFSTTDPFDHLNINIDEDAAPGTYPIYISVTQLLDENSEDISGYYSMMGSVTVLDPDEPDYPDEPDEDKEIVIKSKEIGRYTTSAELELYLSNINTTEFEIEVTGKYPFTVSDMPEAYSSEDITNGKRFVFKSDKPFPTDEPIGHLNMKIAGDAEPGWYNFSANLISITGDIDEDNDYIYCHAEGIEIVDMRNYKEKQFGNLTYCTCDMDNDGVDDYVKIMSCDMNAESVNVPSEIDGLPVKRIREYAFSYRQYLRTAKLPDTVDYIGYSAFAECYKLRKVTLPSSLKVIPPSMFIYCTNLKNVVIPESVTEISSGAFAYTAVKYVTLPKNIVEIGEYAFGMCSDLESIVIENPDCIIDKNSYTISSGYTEFYDSEKDYSYSGPEFNGVIYGHSDSTAEAYAESENLEYPFKLKYSFKTLDDYTPVEYVEVTGDVTGDDKVNLYDAIMIARSVLKTVHFSEDEIKIADFNKDNKVNIYDAIAIAKYVLKHPKK